MAEEVFLDEGWGKGEDVLIWLTVSSTSQSWFGGRECVNV